MRKFANSTLTLFVVTITFYTATLESANDGWDILGFPLVFYKYTAGKGAFTLQERYFLSIQNLVIDLLVILSAFIIVNLLLSKVFKPRKT